MNRREVLAGVTALAGAGTLGAYSLSVFDEPPFTLQVYPAEGDETDVTCDLPDGFLDAHPVLADLVVDARDNPIGDPASRGISQDRAATIVSDLGSACQTMGGLYRVDGDWIFISVSGEGAHSHNGDGGHTH